MTTGRCRRGGLGLAAAAVLMACAAPAAAQDNKVEYVHGDPSAEIQFLVELINRARLDPSGEGDRIFADYASGTIAAITNTFEANDPLHWTRAENRALWKSYAPRPALAFNRSLAAASQQWCVIMGARDIVAQSFSDAPGLNSRAVQQGYRPFWLTQLVQGFGTDMLQVHAGWAIDWSLTRDPVTGRTTLANREAVINPRDLTFLRMVEIGAGVITRNRPPPGGLGPKIVTVSMGTSQNAETRFVTGVCYEDKNLNGAYDPGEGVRGVRIDVDVSDYFAISSTSGGYSVPVNGSSGLVTIVASGVQGKASEIFGTQTVTGNTRAFGRPENVKADFVLPVRTPPPAATVVEGDTGTVAAGGSATFDAVVGPIDPARTTIGDIDVEVDVRHADRSRLRLALEAPDGTVVTLWESGPGGADVVGSFDRTLRPVEPLAGLVDRAYAGVWKLHVADAADSDAVVSSWRLSVRPRYEGPLHARSPHLLVSKLKLKQKNKPLADRLTLKCDIDVGEVLDASATDRLSLVIRETEPPYVERMRVAFAGPVGATSVALTGTTNVTFVPSRKGTSRAKLTLDLRDVDLPVLPRDVRLEIAIGDHLVSEDVTLSRGRFNGKRTPPDGGTLRIDQVKSRSHPLGRRTDVRGRFLQPRLPVLPGIIEVRVGDTSGLWRTSPKSIEGSRIVYGAVGLLRKLTLDTRTGRFTIRAVGEHAGVDLAGDLDVAIWIGKDYESIRVRPAVGTDGSFAY